MRAGLASVGESTYGRRMRRICPAILSLALAWAGSGCSGKTEAPPAPPRPVEASSLADFLPAELGGIKRTKLPPGLGPEPPDAVASYISREERRAVSLNLLVVKDLAFSRAQLHGLAPGESGVNQAAKLVLKGFEVQGVRGERVQYLGGNGKSEAVLLLADKLDVRLSVTPARDPDEPIRLLGELDLAGLEAFVKKL
jgi:hypothetical protein